MAILYHKVDIIIKIKNRIEERGSQKALAKEWGISEAYLCDILKGNRAPGPKILNPLGMKKVIRYRNIA